MKSPLRIRGASAAIIAVLMLAAGGGYALASGSGPSPGTITACVHYRTRVLFMGRCRRSARIRWNRQGPQGPPGPIGATGPAGPSAGYSYAQSGSFSLGASNKTVDSVSVPAGGYLAFARVSPTSNSNAQTIHCQLLAPDGGQVDSASVSLAAHTTAPIVLEGATNTSTSGKITVQCSESAGTGVTVEGPHLAAIKLGNVS